MYVAITHQLIDLQQATLEKVFKSFRGHNFKIKPSKCHIGTGSISYLGYEKTAGSGIQPGIAIKDHSLILGPLNKLVRKDSGYTSSKLPLGAKKAILNLALRH